MGLIKLNKSSFGNIVKRQGQSTIKFKSNQVTGYFPLLKLLNIGVGSNDYFAANGDTLLLDTVKREINFYRGYTKLSFRKQMKVRREFNNPECHMVISLLSILGMQNKIQEVISHGILNLSYLHLIKQKQNILITNPIDVFVLAMIKPRDIGKIVISNNYVELDSSLITLFVSEEKYHDKTFLDNNYNKTVAKYLRQHINKFLKDEDVKIEIVPDRILKQYYTNPYSIETNSIFEIMEIDKQVKGVVFNNIMPNLMEV